MAARKKGEPPNQSKAAKKRQYASRTPQARSYKSPKKVSEAGVGNLPVTVARAAQTIARYVAKNQAKPKPKPSTPKKTTRKNDSQITLDMANKAIKKQKTAPQREEAAAKLKDARRIRNPKNSPEGRAAKAKAEYERAERMQAGYKYKGGSGTRRGRPSR